MVDREKIEERRSEVLLELHAKEAFERLYDTMILDEYEHYMESYGEAPDPSDLPTEELKASLHLFKNSQRLVYWRSWGYGPWRRFQSFLCSV